jgi:hydrogenase nickel incorporation protein HypA/HybF
MHELSLAASILEIVEAAARREPFARVRSLHLSAPALSGVEVDALRFALRSIAPGTLIEGAELRVDEPASQARCRDCDAEIEVRAHGDACPRCGGWRWRATAGTELRLLDLMVE